MVALFSKMVRIIGMHNCGKTEVVEQLIGELRRRGWRVGTIKHSGHHHTFDRPGSDTDRHRRAGAQPAAIIARGECAVFLPEPDHEDPYALLAPLYRDCDLVILEGHAASPGGKIEVWRRRVGGDPPLATRRRDIIAVVSDDELDLPLPRWPRRDIAFLADRAEELAGLRQPEEQTSSA